MKAHITSYEEDIIIDKVIHENMNLTASEIMMTLRKEHNIFVGLSRISNIKIFKFQQSLQPISFTGKVVEMWIDEMEYGTKLPKYKLEELSRCERELLTV